MNYAEAEKYLEGVSWLGIKPGLERISELLARLGNPERKCRFVHVAGTNGKGSTSTMLASMLTSAGYRTGLYTSPHLLRVTERMRVDGAEMPREGLAEAVSAHVRHKHVIAKFHGQLEYPRTVPVGHAAVAVEHDYHRRPGAYLIIFSRQLQTIVRFYVNLLEGIGTDIVHQGQYPVLILLILGIGGDSSGVVVGAGGAAEGLFKAEVKEQKQKQ